MILFVVVSQIFYYYDRTHRNLSLVRHITAVIMHAADRTDIQ